MNESHRPKPVPELSKTRTGKDWGMITLGICLVILFLVAGYLSRTQIGSEPISKPRGPVKDPKGIGLEWSPDRTARFAEFRQDAGLVFPGTENAKLKFRT